MKTRVAHFRSVACTAIVACAMDACSVEKDELRAGELELRARESNRVARAKEVFRFDEFERDAPRYRSAVTNWAPVLLPCDGITNYFLTRPASGDEMRYRGDDESRWVDVDITCLASAREAHEYLMKQLAGKSIGTMKAADLEENAKRRIGDRCSLGEFPGVSSVTFIRNNCLVRVWGRYVKVESLARELDRQILEVSNRAGGSPAGSRTDRSEGTNAVDDAGSEKRRTRADGPPP